MRYLALVLLCLLIFSGIKAQTEISGIINDKSSRKPIEFASVSLLQLPDSVVTKGTASNKKGRFVFESVLPGSYIIRCSFIGYSTLESRAFLIEAGMNKFITDTLGLINDSKTLDQVTVTGTKAQLNTSIDRKTCNVEQDVMSRAGSAADILKNIPSVEVDVDGNVALRGSGDVVILINGKPNPLMGRTRAEVLQQLPANSIERIEVITNPSARYRPNGTSGIINIVLKKNIRNGFNGIATFNAGNRDRYNGAVSLNYRPKKFNLFGSYSARQDFRKRYNNIDRNYFDGTSGDYQSNYTQITNSNSRSHAHIATIGVDYNLNDKNSFGASGNYFVRKQTRKDNADNITIDNAGSLIGDYTRLRYDPEKQVQHSLTTYYQHNFGEDHDLRIEFNHSKEDEIEDNHYSNIVRKPNSASTFDNTKIQQGNKQNQLTVDYSNLLSESSKLEAGYDGLYNMVDLNFYGEYFDEAQKIFVKDIVKSNQFIYKEDVHALYGTFQKSYTKFGYEAGLRAEGVFTRGHLVNLDSFVTNNYFKVYPTVHLSYKLKENSELQLNYSKRVNRPEADELNPFPEYQDPRNLRAGNPKLLPEVIHSTEFGYKWQHRNFSIVPSIYYRYKVHGFTSVVVPLNDTTLLTTNQNLSNDQSAGLEIILSAKGKFFTTTVSSNLFYNRINAANLGYIQNKSIYSATVNLTTSFNLGKTTMLQISSNYRSARLTPQGKLHPSFVFNSGLRQDLFKNHIALTVTASDIFSTLRQESEFNIPTLKQHAIARRDGLIMYLGISYKFGVIKKAKEEKLQFENN